MKPEELEYNGDKILKYGENDYVGFYYNADDDINQVRGKSYEEVCKKLDEYNAIVSELRQADSIFEKAEGY